MRLVVTIATGDKFYGELALNLCLSIKSSCPETKVAIIYTPSAMEGIEHYVDWFYDYGIRVSDKYEMPHEQAFYLKTQLYDIITKAVPDATEILYMDADTLMLPNAKVSDWFEEHKNRDFTAFCNDYYDYGTRSRKRSDYTFWCDPEDMRHMQSGMSLGYTMPQINSSFVYFRNTANAQMIFLLAQDCWSDTSLKFKTYKGVKPDEFCLNVASSLAKVLPHKHHYHPIHFQCFNECIDEAYILQHYKAFGFAGEQKIADSVVVMYDKYVKYYRKQFGMVEEFKFDPDKKRFKDANELQIKPIAVKTLFRRGEVPNSEGGIFNPSGVMSADGCRVTVFRKEKALNGKRQYSHSTSIPYKIVEMPNGAILDKELQLDGFSKGERVEDFRIFTQGRDLYCSHSIITNNLRQDIKCEIGISLISDGKLSFQYYVRPNLEASNIEKNYAFISDGDELYCLYCVSPYTVYKRVANEWAKMPLNQPKFNWLHKDQFICNSTHPILIDDHYLMFFHTKEGGKYFQGALLLDKTTKEITHATPYSLPIKTCNEGMVAGLNYLSGALYLPKQNIIRLFIGEGDSHSVINDYDATNLMNVIKRFRI
jgi:hypothetical protein